MSLQNGLQTFYRGGSKHKLSNPQSIDANLSEIVIEDTKKLFKEKAKNECGKVLRKLILKKMLMI